MLGNRNRHRGGNGAVPVKIKDSLLLIGFVLLALSIPACIGTVLVLRAKWQAEIWQQQGVSISTLEVLMGLRPAGTAAK